PTDADLVREVLQGDDAAFHRLVEKYYPRLFRLIHGIVADWQQAEDVCQEVFVSVYRKLPGFHFRSKLSTWLFRIAVNAALKSRTRNARYKGVQNIEDIDAPAARRDERRGELESSEVVTKLLRPLPEGLRSIVLLREHEGLSYKEIAAVVGCSTGAVEQRLHRAFVRLREIWKDHLDEFGLE
ncbi:MAG: sigma-70 family RNA polymerase sigma factor, partial [Planctomycetota bacterium]